MKCAEKIRYNTQADADSALREMKKFRRNRGRALRRLVAYQCGCGGWHIGHSGRKYGGHHQARLKPAAAQQQQVPSWGSLRRKLERLNRQIDRYNRHRAKQVAKLIQQDRELAEAQESVQAVVRQVEAMFLGPVNR